MKKLLAVSLQAIAVFALAVTTVQAATYNFLINGDVILGNNELAPNQWNLNGGDVIIASGTFTADLGALGNETGTVSFATAGNTLSIDMLDGSFLTAADDDSGVAGFPELVFTNGVLTEFNFLSAGIGFNSNFTFFDNLGESDFLGEWGTATLSEVPIPAAAWLFGSALLALAGLSKKKRV